MSFDILPCHKVHYFKALFQIFLFKDYWEWSRWCFWTRGGIYIPIKGTIRKTLLRSERDYLALLVGEYKIWRKKEKNMKKGRKSSEGDYLAALPICGASWPSRLHIFMQALSPAHKIWRCLKRCNKFGRRLFGLPGFLFLCSRCRQRTNSMQTVNPG